MDSETLRSFSLPGTCANDVCAYESTDTSCAQGCLDGSCLGDCSQAWSYEEIGNTYGVGGDASLSLDGAGNPHILHYNASTPLLVDAVRSSLGTWDLEDVQEGGGNVGSDNDLALDANGNLSASYSVQFGSSEIALVYAFKPLGEGTSWTTEFVTTGGFKGLFSAIAVDSADGVHISHVDSDEDSLLYSFKASNGTWVEETVDTGQIGGASKAKTSIVVDASGAVHITYSSFSPESLKYAHRTPGGTWTIETVDPVETTESSLILDASGVLHIAYHDHDEHDLKYARKAVGGDWTVETVESVGDVGGFPDIAIDSQGSIHIVHSGFTEGPLRHTERVDGAWQSEILDAAATAGNSIFIDSADILHVGYYTVEFVNNNLETLVKYATRSMCP